MLTQANAISLRCGLRLITEGDYKAKVLAKCGEPDHVEIWEEMIISNPVTSKIM
jgi:hypothetical protein